MTNSDGFDSNPPNILLPYQEWIEAAYRQVARNAVKYAAQNGLPGNHSLYLTFDTTYPGVSIPSRLKAQYPNEMTIVLQHQFWDLTVNEQEKKMSVGLSFGGVASILVIPFGAFTAFSDPEAKLLLTFTALPPSILSVADNLIAEINENENNEEASKNTEEKEEGQIISLDAFRKKHD
ncbi:SspB family protein [Commensalibacter papalotli (ex Botero et al. 2024)]|uniref:Predicted to bind SsrA peptide (SspB2) n=1 Tax=Commensalibacter papalotli (ex Botero et al. 2024) TaxID=2972766 RepID=A0ABM9HK34_9PROT|nr:ClpXP protease specificity-enhancing factor SspB [Commensalibacter papalotli (ex Botero et al. 2024)]CAI3922541.1 SspB-like protein [Commensalibacter papalotli (ex Botero et al. 2024)]CAI3929643.1 SspB-like protein [Commensalibacter papalotli (ex Botero et al. 2024)]